MRKLILTLLLLGSVALSGCASSTPTSEPTLTVPAPTSEPTLAVPAPTAEFTVPSTSSVVGPDPGCTVVTRQPTPGPTQMSLFPAVTKEDHVKGPDDARITIIEYSDFQ